MKRTPLTRTGRLPRRTPLRAKGGDRFKGKRDDAFRRWIRRHPCLLLFDRPECYSQCRHRAECAHVKTRGAGAGDVGECVPLCPLAHRLATWSVHRDGITSFQARFDLDLPKIARYLGERYAAGEEPDSDPLASVRYDLAAIAARLAATHDQEDAGR